MKPLSFATGLVDGDSGVDAFAEAAARAALGLGGAPCDVALVFAGQDNLAHAGLGLEAVHDRLRPAALAGCGAQGVVATGREVETGGVVVWAASLGAGSAQAFHLEAQPAGEGRLAISGMPDVDDDESLVMFVDPYTFPAEALLTEIARSSPGVPVVGGLAAAEAAPAALFHDAAVASMGAVGVVLSDVDVHCTVSQGASPIGPEMVVTACGGNVIEELASQPALDRLMDAIRNELTADEQALATQGLLVGIVIDENQPDYERGDYLVRALMSVDEQERTITIGERVRVGQTVRLHVRDAASADIDLRDALERVARELSGPAAGALMFTCNGRGSHMFGSAGHDAGALAREIGPAPAAGFFCAGEIGPVGARSFVHGFSTSVAVFAAQRPAAA
ncbi:MAG TPA: FIST C-terminal domain-containing protein [Thermoleophilaceae bacterium]|jgi:small ligand-binding sensory domain FIST|nr:FIST C-terminal domain-containing protein [Thermoleophilaceae bacterium]